MPSGKTSLAVRAIIGAVRLYQHSASIVLGRSCRFLPSCSSYAIQAIARKGVRKGLWLTVLRLLRCHPFCAGGFDPVR
ncbi:MAG: membrane protein insertion efficiency factor YidD [Candidatus Omnitrophica bacterium]|nr:membrane protein insertion efficiency factor YidD [Candidatus Omnitrophota bacterium]